MSREKVILFKQVAQCEKELVVYETKIGYKGKEDDIKFSIANKVFIELLKKRI